MRANMEEKQEPHLADISMSLRQPSSCLSGKRPAGTRHSCAMHQKSPIFAISGHMYQDLVNLSIRDSLKQLGCNSRLHCEDPRGKAKPMLPITFVQQGCFPSHMTDASSSKASGLHMPSTAIFPFQCICPARASSEHIEGRSRRATIDESL